MNLADLPFDPSALPIIARRLERELEKRQEKELLEASLIDFVDGAWESIDSAQYQDSWAIGALCEHLQAVTEGQVRKLLINFPPRCGKTLVTSVCWPAWTWARRDKSYWSGPQVKFLCSSYSDRLSLINSNQTRRLILSPWYQARWGDRYELTADQNAKSQFDTTKGGSRFSTSVGGSLLGIGGDVVICDDLHSTQGVESDAERETVVNHWREISSTRLNDPKRSALVNVMQRLRQDDVSGLILDGEGSEEWTHLMIPMEYDSRRHCVTVLGFDEDGDEVGWEDPRTEDGELMWPDRFGFKEVRALERELGSYMASGRLQQAPAPAGGGIFKRDWWQVWPPRGETFNPDTGKPMKPLVFPAMDYIIASLDTAMTTKEENDWSALTVWGCWRNENDLPKVMLMDAWQDRLEFRPLVDKTINTCQDMKVDRLLIEAKANGISVAQEIGRLTRGQSFGVSIVDPKGKDKVARAYAVTSLFEAGIIYAPDRKWADLVLDQASVFPKGSHDDLVDTMTMGLKHLRDIGFALLREEREDDLARRNSLKASKVRELPYAV